MASSGGNYEWGFRDHRLRGLSIHQLLYRPEDVFEAHDDKHAMFGADALKLRGWFKSWENWENLLLNSRILRTPI